MRTASAFIEFNSINNAKYCIKEYNNKIINGHFLDLHWARFNKNYMEKERQKNYYTVRKPYFIMIL